MAAPDCRANRESGAIDSNRAHRQTHTLCAASGQQRCGSDMQLARAHLGLLSAKNLNAILEVSGAQ